VKPKIVNKKLCLKILSFILLFSLVVGNVKAAEELDDFAFMSGSVLSGDYPKLSVLAPTVHGDEGNQTMGWEIHFKLGPNPEQWDRILIGEILADSIKRAPIRWSIVDETGNVWPPENSPSTLEMDWLSPDTMGWSIINIQEMPFEMLRDKQFTIKLTAVLDPVLFSTEDNIEGVLNGTFINCYYDHKLMHYNSSYTGAEAQNVSTALKRVSMYSPKDTGQDFHEDVSDNFHQYDPTQSYRRENFWDDNEIRDLYVEGDEIAVTPIPTPRLEPESALNPTDIQVSDSDSALSPPDTQVSYLDPAPNPSDTRISDSFYAHNSSDTRISDSFYALNPSGARATDPDSALYPSDPRATDSYSALYPSDPRATDSYSALYLLDTRATDSYSALFPSDTRVSDSYSTLYPSDTRVSDSYSTLYPSDARVSDSYSALSPSDAQESDSYYDPYSYGLENPIAPEFDPDNIKWPESYGYAGIGQTPPIANLEGYGEGYDSKNDASFEFDSKYDASFEFDSKLEFAIPQEIAESMFDPFGNLRLELHERYPHPFEASDNSLQAEEPYVPNRFPLSYIQQDGIKEQAFELPSTQELPSEQEPSSQREKSSDNPDRIVYGSAFSYPKLEELSNTADRLVEAPPPIETFSLPDDAENPERIVYGSAFAFPQDIIIVEAAPETPAPMDMQDSVLEKYEYVPDFTFNESELSYPQSDGFEELIKTIEGLQIPRGFALPEDFNNPGIATQTSEPYQSSESETETSLNNDSLSLYSEQQVENTALSSGSGTRSSASRVVSYNSESDDLKSNPGTHEKSIVVNVILYMSLCACVSLFFTLRKYFP